VKPEVVWAPAPLTTKSWADVEDDDDDDYFATTAPLRPLSEAREDDAAAGHEDDQEHSALEQVYPTSSPTSCFASPSIYACSYMSVHINSVTPHHCKTLPMPIYMSVVCMA
jgi:hypothetical protein